MSTLIRGDGNALYIFLNRGGYNFLCGTVVSKMYNFSTGALHDTAHDIDCGIVAIKQRGGGD